MTDNISKFFENKKVFVTGHTGFKGAWLCRMLVLMGADVTGFALDPPTSPSLFDLLRLDQDMRSVIGDIRDGNAVRETLQQNAPDIVIHMAAQPIVRESYRAPAYTYETNVMGTVNILEAVRSLAKVRSVVNVTTDKVYENKEWVWGYREDDRLCGFDPYSNSKSCSELVTYSYIHSFFGDDHVTAVSTARSGNVIGGGDFAADRIIPDCIRAVEKNEEIIIRNAHSTRPYQHVLDCLYGYILLAYKQFEDKSSYAGSYNFGPNGDSCVTTKQLAEMFCGKWGDDAGYKLNAPKSNEPHEANFLKLDISKAAATLGWTPMWGIEQAIEKTVDWTKTFFAGGPTKGITDDQIRSYLEDRCK